MGGLALAAQVRYSGGPPLPKEPMTPSPLISLWDRDIAAADQLAGDVALHGPAEGQAALGRLTWYYAAAAERLAAICAHHGARVHGLVPPAMLADEFRLRAERHFAGHRPADAELAAASGFLPDHFLLIARNLPADARAAGLSLVAGFLPGWEAAIQALRQALAATAPPPLASPDPRDPLSLVWAKDYADPGQLLADLEARVARVGAAATLAEIAARPEILNIRPERCGLPARASAAEAGALWLRRNQDGVRELQALVAGIEAVQGPARAGAALLAAHEKSLQTCDEISRRLGLVRGQLPALLASPPRKAGPGPRP